MDSYMNYFLVWIENNAIDIFTIVASCKWVIFWLLLAFLFRGSISSLLDALTNLCKKIKSTSFEFSSVKVGVNASAPLGSEAINEYSDKINDRYLKAFQSQVVTDLEKIIIKQLEERQYTAKEAITALIYQLANRIVLNQFVLINVSIFKEQILLLRYLNAGNKICSIDELKRFYIKWTEKNPTSTFMTYEKFLEFLMGYGLISQNDGYCITIFGKEYLNFVINIGRDVDEELIEKMFEKDE